MPPPALPLDELKKVYDATCKQVLAEKDILANIMHACVKE